MTLMKDPRSSWIRDQVLQPPAEEAPVEMTITTAELAQMHPSNRTDEAVVYELLGPAQSYFELPMDWFIDADGHVQPATFPGAIRLIQNVHYKSFLLVGDSAEDVQTRALKVHEAVRTESKLRAQISYIWWRLYPKYELESLDGYDKNITKRPARHRVRMRLGTLPVLPTRFWLDLSKEVGNTSSEPLVYG